MKLFDWISGQSSVMKFAIGAIAFLVCYLFVIEPALDRQGTFAARAQTASDSLDDYVSSASEVGRLETQVTRGMERYGPIALPVSFEQRSSELNESIRTILDGNSIKRESITTHTSKMPNSTLADVLPSGQSVELVKQTIRFDATPEQLAQVLADFEQDPFIVGISRIDIRRDNQGQRQVLVDLTVDGWVLEGPGASQ